MKNILTTLIKVTLFFGLGFAMLYFVYKGAQTQYQAKCDLDFVTACVAAGTDKAACEAQLPVAGCSLATKVIGDFKNANLFWLFMVVMAFMLSNVSRALRWNMLIRPLGYKPKLYNTFLATMAGYFANMALPRFGEVVKPGLVNRYEKIPLEKLIGTIVVDRTLDVICLASMMGLAFLLEFNRIWTFIEANAAGKSGGGMLSLVLLLGAVGLFFLLIGFIFRKKIMASAIFEKIKKILLGFWEGILTVGKLERPGLFVFHTIFIWVMYYLMTYFCFSAFLPSAHLGPIAALTVFCFGGLGMVIPAPGGVGSFQYLVSKAMVLYGVGADGGGDDFSFSNINFVTVSFCNIFFGIIAFVLLPILNKNQKPEIPEEKEED